MREQSPKLNCPIVPEARRGTIGTTRLRNESARDNLWDKVGTMSLKTLANRRFSWDNTQDNSGTIDQTAPAELSHEALKQTALVGQFAPTVPAIVPAALSVPCAWCGTPSPPFALVINRDLWLCSKCLPSDPVGEAA